MVRKVIGWAATVATCLLVMGVIPSLATALVLAVFGLDATVAR